MRKRFRRPRGKQASSLAHAPQNKVQFYRNTGSWFTADLELPIKSARLWTPDSPYLYDLKIEMQDRGGKVLDAVGSFLQCGAWESSRTQGLHAPSCSTADRC